MPTLTEALAQTWPAKLAQGVWGGITAPRDAYQGKLDPLSDEGIQRATDLAGTVMGGTFATAPRGALGTGPVLKPIRAYHGSPYDFERFDLSKIGTGEGAQAYGHGLYFAENPAVARDYRNRLKAGNPANMTPDEEAFAAIKPQWDEIAGKLKAIREKDPRMTPESSALQNHLDALYANAVDDTLGRKPWLTEGRMYEVNIHAKPEQFLDWDKPLNQQSSPVTQILREHPLFDPSREVQSQLMPKQIAPSTPMGVQSFSEAGIPGIKYLDQGSRAAGEGSSNYVLFRDDIIDIIKKYGLAGLGIAGLGGEQPPVAKALTQ